MTAVKNKRHFGRQKGIGRRETLERIERQEIYCHNCGRYVQFPIDLGLDGNHVLKCPNCGHEHCRVVKDGSITGDRWDSRNGMTHYVSKYTVSTSTASASTVSYWTLSASTASY